MYAIRSYYDLVGDGDVLKVTVYNHPDLTTTVRVNGGGTIIFPLVGQVNVQGMTIDQVAALLAGALSDGYIVDPQVSVFVEEFRSKRVTIIRITSYNVCYTKLLRRPLR